MNDQTSLKDPGPRPVLTWLPIDKLQVNDAYQRSANSRRSLALIRSIADSFAWSKFQVVTVVPIPTDGWEVAGWYIVDGQHRVAGALLRGDIEEIPCIILELPDEALQAQAFLSLNRDRVSITPFAMHHAAVAAGDATALMVKRICDGAGVEITRYPIMRSLLKPNQTMAISPVKAIGVRLGEARAIAVLKIIREAFPSSPAVGAVMIKAVSAVSEQFGSSFDAGRMVDILRSKADDKWTVGHKAADLASVLSRVYANSSRATKLIGAA